MVYRMNVNSKQISEVLGLYHREPETQQWLVPE